MTRHQRRKAANAKRDAKEKSIVAAHKAWERDQIVKSNLSRPISAPRSERGLGNLAIYDGRNGPRARGHGVTYR